MTDPATCRLTLLVTGLWDVPAGAAVQAPALAALLARADRLDAPPEGFAARLFRLFGVATTPGQDLPIAAVTRLADMGVIDREWWVRADPVYLEPGRGTLVLHPVSLQAGEAGPLAEELSDSLAADGWILRAPHPQRWYAKPPAVPAIVTTPLAEAVGRDIGALLPRGPDGRAWHTRLSELQILLHTARVNAQREARGERPANSVWFWGGGRLPEPGTAHWSAVWCDEPLAQGLARLSGAACGRLPTEVGDWLAQLPAGEHLVVMGAPDHATDPAAQARQLERLSTAWIAPLRRAVARARLASITVLADRGPAFEYRRAHRLRFWRRARPLPFCRAA